MSQADRRAHFRSMLASCVDDARLGTMAMRLELVDGAVVEGRPVLPMDADDEVIELDGRRVPLESVRAYTVLGPDHDLGRPMHLIVEN